jgi:hypothetical protein
VNWLHRSFPSIEAQPYKREGQVMTDVK